MGKWSPVFYFTFDRKRYESSELSESGIYGERSERVGFGWCVGLIFGVGMGLYCTVLLMLC